MDVPGRTTDAEHSRRWVRALIMLGILLVIALVVIRFGRWPAREQRLSYEGQRLGAAVQLASSYYQSTHSFVGLGEAVKEQPEFDGMAWHTPDESPLPVGRYVIAEEADFAVVATVVEGGQYLCATVTSGSIRKYGSGRSGLPNSRGDCAEDTIPNPFTDPFPF